MDKEGDTADKMQDEEGDPADGNAGIGATLQTDMQTSEEQANKERLEAKKQPLHAAHGDGGQAIQRNRRAARRERKIRWMVIRKKEKRGLVDVVSDATKRFRGSTENQPVWSMIAAGVKMDDESVDVD